MTSLRLRLRPSSCVGLDERAARRGAYRHARPCVGASFRPLPGRPGERQRVLGAVPDLATSLTPAPVAARRSQLCVQGGPQPELLFGRHAVARGVDPDAVTAVLAALAGYLVRESRQPTPPGLPGHAFQQDHSRPASRRPIVVEVSRP